jgi:Raf kinase inhibitor-like YbhB/YbcL family protein
MKRIHLISALMLLICVTIVCAESEKKDSSYQKEESQMELTSPAFNDGAMIPSKYTCDSVDVSPHLAISIVPEGVKSFALICDDPDAPAGTWVHWVIFNLPADLRMLPEGIPQELRPSIGKDSSGKTIQGINDSRRFGYSGPCPPRGPAHRYFFKLYALDTTMEFVPEKIKEGITARELMQKMNDHILDKASLMGRYKR